MFKDLKGKFNRATVNHPVKIALGTISVPLNSIGLLALPFDGGITLCVTGGVTGLLSKAGTSLAKENKHKHSTYKDITHDGETYRLTIAQAEAYKRAQNEINAYKKKFEETYKDKEKRKLLNKAQKVADFQQDIINGAGSLKEAQNSNIKFDLKYRKNRSKLPKN